MSTTSIEWTDINWNVLSGCDKTSPGCKNCYAEPITKRFSKVYPNGFKLSIREEWFDRMPKNPKEPRKVFVNSISDTFHEKVPLEYIQRMFDVMNGHVNTFQVLTKRSQRVVELSDHLTWTDNIWLGVSVENSDYVYRIDDLRQTGAKLKFISFEPLLGPISADIDLSGIDWVIVGGESGTKARPIKKEWVLDIKAACNRQNIPLFFKQWGRPNFNPDQNDPTIKTKSDTDETDHEAAILSEVTQVKGGCQLDGKVYQNYPDAAPLWGVVPLASVEKEIQSASNDVKTSLQTFQDAWISVAYNLKVLKDRMDQLAGTHNPRKYWQTYLSVDSFKDYCNRILDFSDKKGYQLLESYNCIESRWPQLFKDNTDYVPSYTKLQPFISHANILEAEYQEEYKVIESEVLDKDVGRIKLSQHINEVLGQQKPSDFDAATYLEKTVRKKLEQAIPEGMRGKLDDLLNQLKALVE